jgi:hypothetical protein
VPAERKRTIVSREVNHRLRVITWDLLVCHAGRQNRPMGSGGLAVETGNTLKTSGGTPWVNH